eukprot:gene10776-12745_t
MTVCAEHIQVNWTTESFLICSPIFGELAKLVKNPPVPSTCSSVLSASLPQCLRSDNIDHSTDEPANELEAILSLNPEQLDDIADAFSQALPGLLKEAINTLKPSPAESHPGKFSLSETFSKFQYSNLSTFFGGLVKVLGTPNVVPNLEENMRREHVSCADSTEEFKTSNYGITTTSKVEWEFVVSPVPHGTYPCETTPPQNPREAKPLEHFLEVMNAVNEKLTKAEHDPLLRVEVIALRLYTGPMFAKYNPLLREVISNPQYKGNRYVNTIIAINSGILKLSKIQPAVKVFRGLHGRVLPEQFWQPNEYNIMGGVEMGFMSATTRKEVAMDYAKTPDERTPAFLFEMQMGMIDRGADISLFSQYPEENEVVFAPLTGMEVLGMRPKEGHVQVMEMRLSCNLTSQTIEQILGKRKDAVLHLCEDELQEVKHQVQKGTSTRRIDMQPLEDVKMAIENQKANMFNQSRFFLENVERVLNARDDVMCQLTAPTAFQAVAKGDSKELKRMVPAYMEKFKDADGNTLLTCAIARLGPACDEMVNTILALPSFVMTVNGLDKDGKPPYLLAAELGLNAVARKIIKGCGEHQVIDVQRHAVPAAAARILAEVVVECRAQILSVNGIELRLNERHSDAHSAGPLNLSELLAADRSNVGAWTVGLLLSTDQWYLPSQLIILDKKSGSISADSIRDLAGAAECPNQILQPWQNKQVHAAFICGLLITGSSPCTSLDLSGGIFPIGPFIKQFEIAC